MKIKLTFVLIAGFLAFKSLNAQENKFQLGGALGSSFSNNSYESNNNTRIYFNITTDIFFGYHFTKNLVLGSKLSYALYKSRYGNSAANKMFSNDIIFSPVMKYYVNDLFFSLKLDVGNSYEKFEGSIYNEYTGEIIDLGYTNKYLIFGSGLGIGYSIWLNESTCFEPSINYNFNKYFGIDDSQDKMTRDIIFNLGIVFNW